jgi:CheY-like chemotaxis protein
MTKILLVEDDKSLREIYGVRLLAEGYDIISAGDGEAALAMAIKERPSLIVSDVMMPKISGFDMLDILRSTTETKNIKVIMMTALSSEDQRARGEALGADRYLVKSQVGIEDVVRTVHDVLGDAPVPPASAVQTFGGPSAPRPAGPIPTPTRSVQPLQQTMPTPPPFTAGAAPQPRPAQLQPAASTASSALPQPTAPFSTTRPANLGERVLHPVAPSSQKPDIASLMAQELGQTNQPAAPVSATSPLPTPPPAPPVSYQPQPTPTPVAPTPPAAPVATPAPIGIPPTPTPPPAPTPVAPPPTAGPQSNDEPTDTGISFEETPRTPGPQPPSSPFGAQPPRP